MKKSKIFFGTGCLLVLVAILFLIFAFNHPEMSFPWNNNVTLTIYGIYAVFTIAMFVLSAVLKKR